MSSTTLRLLKTIDKLTGEEPKETEIDELADIRFEDIEADDQTFDEDDQPESSMSLSSFEKQQQRLFATDRRQCGDCGDALPPSSKYRQRCVRCYNKFYSQSSKEKLRLCERLKSLEDRERLLSTAKAGLLLGKPVKKPMVVVTIPNNQVCGECGVVVSKFLYKGKCIRCFQKVYQKDGEDQGTRVKKEATDYEYLLAEPNDALVKHEPDDENASDGPSTSSPYRTRAPGIPATGMMIKKENNDCMEYDGMLSERAKAPRCKLTAEEKRQICIMAKVVGTEKAVEEWKRIAPHRPVPGDSTVWRWLKFFDEGSDLERKRRTNKRYSRTDKKVGKVVKEADTIKKSGSKVNVRAVADKTNTPKTTTYNILKDAGLLT